MKRWVAKHFSSFLSQSAKGTDSVKELGTELVAQNFANCLFKEFFSFSLLILDNFAVFYFPILI